MTIYALKHINSATWQRLFATVVLSTAALVTGLICISILFHALFVSAFWPWFAVTCTLATLVWTAAKYGLSKSLPVRCVVFITILISICVSCAVLAVLTGGARNILNYADFYFIREPYIQKVAMTTKGNTPRFISFEWKVGGSDQNLYFDESDELGKPCRPKSRDWWLRVKDKSQSLLTTAWTSRKVANHFYVVQFDVYGTYTCSLIPPLD